MLKVVGILGSHKLIKRLVFELWLFLSDEWPNSVSLWRRAEFYVSLTKGQIMFLSDEGPNYVSLWRRANARNVRLYYPYWQYTNLFIFRFVSLLCIRSTLRLFHKLISYFLSPFQLFRSNLFSVISV